MTIAYVGGGTGDKGYVPACLAVSKPSAAEYHCTLIEAQGCAPAEHVATGKAGSESLTWMKISRCVGALFI